jgi:hypothetical protein
MNHDALLEASVETLMAAREIARVQLAAIDRVIATRSDHGIELRVRMRSSEAAELLRIVKHLEAMPGTDVDYGIYEQEPLNAATWRETGAVAMADRYNIKLED